MTRSRLALAGRLLVAAALVGRLGGLLWLPPAIVSAGVLLAWLAVDWWSERGGTLGQLQGRIGWYPLALAGLVILTVVVRVPSLGADIGHQPLDIDGHRLGASIRNYFLTGALEHRTVENYPGIVFWAMSASALGAFLYNLMSGAVRSIDATTVGQFMVAGRVLNVFAAAGTVACVARLARRLSGRGAAVAAAAVVAFAPLSIETTTDMRNDPGQVLLLVATVLLSLMAANVDEDEGRRRPTVRAGDSSLQVLVAAGACAGLAAGVKYTSVFALVPVLLVALGAPASIRLRRAGAALGAFVVAVAVSNHFIWWDFSNFVRQLSDQILITGRLHWAASDNPAAFHRQVLAEVGPGWPLLVLAAGWSAWSLATGRWVAWVFLSFPLLYSWFTAHRPSQFARWVYPLLPFVAVAGACGLAALLRPLSRRAWAAGPVRAAIAVVVSAAVVAPPVWGGVGVVSRRLQPTTAVLLERWLAASIAPGDVVLLERGWLDLDGAKFTVARVPDLKWALSGDRRALAAADWVVVPETHFATPGVSEMALAHALAATPRDFGGHLGFDYRVYRAPRMPPVDAEEVRLDDATGSPALSWEWGPRGARGPGRPLPDGSAVVYLSPHAGSEGVLEVDLANGGANGDPVPIVVTIDARPVSMSDSPAAVGIRRLTAHVELPRADRALTVRLDPVRRRAGVRVVAVRLRNP